MVQQADRLERAEPGQPAGLFLVDNCRFHLIYDGDVGVGSVEKSLATAGKVNEGCKTGMPISFVLDVHL